MPRVRHSGDQQVRLRAEVLTLDGLMPKLGPSAIARMAAKNLKRPVNPATVRSILKRFRGVVTVPADRPRSGRPSPFSARLKRYEPVLFLCTIFGLYRKILRKMEKKPKWGLLRVINKVFNEYRDAQMSLPPGAVVVMPKKPHLNTVRKCVPVFFVCRCTHTPSSLQLA